MFFFFEFKLKLLGVIVNADFWYSAVYADCLEVQNVDMWACVEVAACLEAVPPAPAATLVCALCGEPAENHQVHAELLRLERSEEGRRCEI